MTEDEARALVEQAFQVNELTRHPGWDVFVDCIRFAGGGAARRQMDLISGGAKDFTDYGRRVGWLEGVEYALKTPERLQQQALTARELLEQGGSSQSEG